MELWQAILISAIKEYEGDIVDLDLEKLFEKECYLALNRIRAILDDDSLEDKSCFDRIEKIVCEFEQIGSDGGSRHDFG